MNHSTPTPHFPDNLKDYAPWVAKHGLYYPYGECQCGCGQKTNPAQQTERKNGWRVNEPLRYVFGHKRNLSLSERFYKYVTPGPIDECWLWRGHIMGGGYGHLAVGEKRHKPAHRVSWELHFGPIPKGMFVCHKCDVRNCVNPYHLFVGFQQDNMDDMNRKGRHFSPAGEVHPHRKLTASDVIEIRSLSARGVQYKEIAAQFGISRAHISGIVHRKFWSHIP